MRSRLLLLLLLGLAVAAAIAAAATDTSAGPSFWAMDPRLLTPEPPPHPQHQHQHQTPREQAATERLVWARYQQRANDSSDIENGVLPFPLHTARHVRLLVGVLGVREEEVGDGTGPPSPS